MLQIQKKAPSPWLYLIGTLMWTWSLLGIVAISGHHYLEFPYSLIMLIGGLGPLIFALMLISLGKWDRRIDKSPLHFLKRSLSPWTVPWKGYLSIVLLLLGFAVLPLILDPAAGKEQEFFQIGPSAFIIIGFLFGALEEIGWRGYAQEAFSKLMAPVSASLVIGIFWALWHFPLFFIEGTYQNSLGFGSQSFWLFFITIILTSPIYGWLYHQWGKSAFAPLLFHGLGNAVYELTADVSPVVSAVVQSGITILVVVLFWKSMGPAGRYHGSLHSSLRHR